MRAPAYIRAIVEGLAEIAAEKLVVEDESESEDDSGEEGRARLVADLFNMATGRRRAGGWRRKHQQHQHQ